MANQSLPMPVSPTRAAALGDAAALAARLMLAWLFVAEGYGKISAYADVQTYMAEFGVSASLLPLVILTELGGGLLVALGLLARPAALALAGFCVLAALIFHRGGGYDETLQLQKDVAIAGGFLVLAARGAGDWSLDAWIKWRRGASGQR